MSLQEKLAKIKEAKRMGHDCVVQVKIPRELRSDLNTALSSDELSYKDLFLAAIQDYLEKRTK